MHPGGIWIMILAIIRIALLPLLAGLSAPGIAQTALADDLAPTDMLATASPAVTDSIPIDGPKPAAAAQPHAAAASNDRDTLTGDWGGLRPRLAADGIAFRADYVSEAFTVASGGLRKGTAYTQQIRASVDLDMDPIAGWRGGTFHLTINDRRGHGISSDFVGNRLPIQEAYGGQFTKLSELSYEQDFGHGAVNMRIGYFAMGNDLGGISAGCNFVNAAFCAHPLSMSGDSSWYNYPNARWGAAFRIRARDNLFVRTGIYQVNPALGLEKNAFRPFAGHTSGVILPIEIEYTPGQRPGDHALPGSYKLGFYYDTADAARTSRTGTGTVSGRMGYYFLMSQTILREGTGKRGLAVIGAYTVNPRVAAQITRWYMAGLIQTGTFTGRDSDTVGLGLVHAVLNPRLREAYAEINNPMSGMDALPQGETAIELSYGLQLTPWLILRPDVQYIVEPGAFSYAARKDAVAVGGQVKMQF